MSESYANIYKNGEVGFSYTTRQWLDKVNKDLKLNQRVAVLILKYAQNVVIDARVEMVKEGDK